MLASRATIQKHYHLADLLFLLQERYLQQKPPIVCAYIGQFSPITNTRSDLQGLLANDKHLADIEIDWHRPVVYSPVVSRLGI